MKQSHLFAKLTKKPPKNAKARSHQLLHQAGFIDQCTSGVYFFLPLGWKVMNNIADIIRTHMEKIGSQEVLLPSIQPKNLWLKSGRWTTIDPPLFKFKDRHKRDLCLGPTHEEVITDLVKNRVKSYKDLPFALFQIQNKFRNEMRATSGLLRCREFIMKDLYSFHSTEKDLDVFYNKVKQAYSDIFTECGLQALPVEADCGTVGGSESHEFMVLSSIGEDTIYVCEKKDWAINEEKIRLTNKKINKCPQCKAPISKHSAIEAGHIFKLGTKYSKKMKAEFVDKSGQAKPVIMGCYGIGVGRLMGIIAQVHNDKNGLIWPRSIAPFTVHLLSLPGVKKQTDKIYNKLIKAGVKVLYNDNDDSPGEKFAQADLIGLPLRMVVSAKTLKKHSVELKKRTEDSIKLVKIKNLTNYELY